MLKIKQVIAIVLMIACAAPGLFAQGKPYVGPEDGAGDPNLEREGKMTGNRAMISIKNNTELGEWPRTDTSRWPNTADGTKMNDGIGLLLGARVYITQDTVPVTDMNEVAALAAQGLIDTLYFCQTNYREEMDFDPTGTIEWGLHGAPGYSNINAETPAFSNDPDTWPLEGWPAVGFDKKWQGEWDGRFGKGKSYADLESYMVANDAQDQEYLGDDDRVKYYPRPGINIGDFYDDITIQRGAPWGGLGVRVELRAFQWNNPHARDCIFFEYNIANVSDYDLPEMTFGYWMDNNIGGAGGEMGYYRQSPYNLAYAWDLDGIGQGGLPSGVQGFAYLESPGISDDLVDNDNDGLIDEKRDNPAGELIGPTEGIADLAAFLAFYKMEEADLKEHWSGDEDQDWVAGDDVNGDGVYSEDEWAGDDVGTDGVAPGDLNYTAPDADGSEGNGKPDFTEGIGSEPNFAETDISESDMLGLTTFQLFPIPQHTPPYDHWFRNDKSMWEVTSSDSISEESANISNNLGEVFASGVFPLFEGRTERVSMALLYSYEDLTTITAPGHGAPALFSLKETVQIIYEKDYRFAQPPLMPTLTAIPGDGQVTLIWDNRSDTKTKEPLLRGLNDFEGYKLFRATDKFFADPVTITDGYGTPTFAKPIFQCDKVDGKIGFTDFGLTNGMGYYLGSDSGISHSFVDETVENGRTYYYALVAYDYGIEPASVQSTSQEDSKGIPPSENNYVIDRNESEEIIRIGGNVAIVTPGVNPAGYDVQANFDVDDSGISIGSGTVVPELAIPELVKDGHTYKVKFQTETLVKRTNASQLDVLRNYEERGLIYVANGVEVYDVTEGNVNVFSDVQITDENGNPTTSAYTTMLELSTRDERTFYSVPTEPTASDIFDGIRVVVQMDSAIASFAAEKSGWLGDVTVPVNIQVPPGIPYAPWDYYVVFTDETYQHTMLTSGIKDATGSTVKRADMVQEYPFNFKVENRTFPADEDGNYEILPCMVHDLNANGTFEMLEDEIIVCVKLPEERRVAGTVFVMDFQGAEEANLPQTGDTYMVSFNRPFFSSDSLMFTVDLSEEINKDKLKSDMDSIKVVPNPYVATNMMEPAVANYLLNQDRRITFTHIPEQCTIKIFTVAGVLVDEIHAPEDGIVAYADPDGNELGQYRKGAIHWDLLSREGLEIAAGMYIFHVKDDVTGHEKIGKFAIIK